MRGGTTAFLNPSGTRPSDNEQFISLIIDGRSILIHSLTRNVGHGSIMHDCVVELTMILQTSSFETWQNELNFGGIEEGSKMEAVFFL